MNAIMQSYEIAILSNEESRALAALIMATYEASGTLDINALELGATDIEESES